MDQSEKTVTTRIKRLLNNNTTDFRFIPFGFVLLYLLVLLYSEFCLGSYAVIGNYLKIYPAPYFWDLKVLICGLDAVREGANPYTAVCFDGTSTFNYPYIWGTLSFLPFLTMSNLIWLGLALALILFTALWCFIGKINFRDAAVYTLLLISPAVMFGVERGNCDLIIFLLLMIPVLYKKSNSLLAAMVLITSLLKLFPVGAILSILNKGTKKSFWWIVSIILIFSVYLILTRENIMLVSHKTPRPYGLASFGLGGIPSVFTAHLQNYPSLLPAVFPVYIVLMLVSFFLFYRYAQKKLSTPLVDSGSKGFSYLIGAGIFITTCLIGHNFEYRLIFLLFTIPQILNWKRENTIMAKGMLILTLLIVWQSIICAVLHTILYYHVSQVFVVGLFLGHLYILLNFMMSYYRKVMPTG